MSATVAGLAEAGRKFLHSEFARLAVLAAAGVWLLHPFATGRLYGAGDALWYADVLADFVAQLRRGIFPVFVGQTEFAFNGAAYPLRVAPLYQHLAGVIDLLTLRQLSFFWLQHLCVIVCGAAGLLASYLSLCAIAPARRWAACGLAILYLSCPGILGDIYVQDLYMTWMTVPFLPLAAYGIVRTFRRDDLRSQLWLGAPLAALWMGHAPIALWTTLVAALSQGVRLAVVHRGRAAWTRACVGAAGLALLAQYPFVSVACLRAPGGASVVAAGLPHAGDIVANVHGVFPAVLLPVSPGGTRLSDLQLGYALGAALMAALACLCLRPSWPLGVLLAGAAGLLGLLLPISPVDWLWGHLPGQVQTLTYYWPMQRFYPIVAALVAAAAQLSGDAIPSREGRLGGAGRGVLLTLAGCCAWSLWESRAFILAGHGRRATAEFSALAQRPENLMLMNHSYGLFPAPPPYFTNGVTSPEAETRLTPAVPAEPAFSGEFVGATDANPGILDLEPRLRLAPGRRYDLTFRFRHPDAAGVLQIAGRGFFRQYALPRSGRPLAFGAAPGNSRTLPLWTTDPAGTEVALSFIPTEGSPGRLRDFADYDFREADPAAHPVSIVSLAPFRAEVRSGGEARLETPRVYQPGYAASVDGRPVPARPSAAGLVEVAVPGGRHEVEVRFAAPARLLLSYGLGLAASAVAWLALAGKGSPRARS